MQQALRPRFQAGVDAGTRHAAQIAQRKRNGFQLQAAVRRTQGAGQTAAARNAACQLDPGQRTQRAQAACVQRPVEHVLHTTAGAAERAAHGEPVARPVQPDVGVGQARALNPSPDGAGKRLAHQRAGREVERNARIDRGPHLSAGGERCGQTRGRQPGESGRIEFPQAAVEPEGKRVIELQRSGQPRLRALCRQLRLFEHQLLLRHRAPRCERQAPRAAVIQIDIELLALTRCLDIDAPAQPGRQATHVQRGGVDVAQRQRGLHRQVAAGAPAGGAADVAATRQQHGQIAQVDVRGRCFDLRGQRRDRQLPLIDAAGSAVFRTQRTDQRQRVTVARLQVGIHRPSSGRRRGMQALRIEFIEREPECGERLCGEGTCAHLRAARQAEALRLQRGSHAVGQRAAEHGTGQVVGTGKGQLAGQREGRVATQRRRAGQRAPRCDQRQVGEPVGHAVGIDLRLQVGQQQRVDVRFCVVGQHDAPHRQWPAQAERQRKAGGHGGRSVAGRGRDAQHIQPQLRHVEPAAEQRGGLPVERESARVDAQGTVVVANAAQPRRRQQAAGFDLNLLQRGYGPLRRGSQRTQAGFGGKHPEQDHERQRDERDIGQCDAGAAQPAARAQAAARRGRLLRGSFGGFGRAVHDQKAMASEKCGRQVRSRSP